MRNNKGITIAALIVAIIGLSIGFAAFSNTLTIRSTATVNPSSENFQVKFSKVNSADQTGSSYQIIPIISAANETAGVTGGNGTIDSNNPLLLTGLQANFNAPGQSVSYKLYVRNTGNYTAYLTNLDFKNIAGGDSFIDCSGNDVTTSLRTAACNDISVSVTIGGSDGVGGNTYTSRDQTLTNEINTITLNSGASAEVYVTISYADNNHYIDGNMTVTFGDIMLEYRSVNTPLAIPEPQVETRQVVLPEYVVTNQGVITEYNGNGGNITIPSTLPLYEESQYEYVKLDECISVAEDSGYDSTTASNVCTQMKSAVEAGNLESVDSNMYEGLKYYDVIVQGYEATGTNVTVTGIGNNVFQHRNLTNITIPSSVTSIGQFAFEENSIVTLDLSSATSLTTIGSDAFAGSNVSYTSVTIGKNQNDVNIAAFAFMEGTTLIFNDGTITFTNSH